MTELEKAVKHFKGVWPEGWANMIVSTDKNTRHGYGCYQNYNGDSRDLRHIVGLNAPMWYWICSKDQFMEVASNIKKSESKLNKEKNYWNGTDPFEVGRIVKQGEIVFVDGVEVCIKDGKGLFIVNSSLGSIKPVEQIDLLWNEWVEMGKDKNDAYGFGKFVLSEIKS